MWLVSFFLLAQAPPVDQKAVARTAAEEFARGRYAELYARFDDRMRGAVSEPALRDVVAPQVLGSAGPFEKVDGETVCQTAGELQSCVTPLLFAQARILLRIAAGPDGKVVGLFVAGMEPRGASLFIEAGKLRLPAYLSLPAAQGPHPVVVLVHGSGALDADETVGPNKPFRDLAEGLARKGVGTLRYFKRNRLAPLAPDATLYDEVIDDAIAAIRLARTQPGVDPKRVFLLGHSLGGSLAPRIAELDGKLRGVILLAGSNRPLRELVADQVRHLTGSDKNFEQVWSSLPAHYRNGLPDYDPAASAKALPAPILVLHAERDYQVTVKDFERWQAALGRRKDAVLKSYPKLNHLFQEGEGKSMPAEYMKPGQMAGYVIDDIASWIEGLR